MTVFNDTRWANSEFAGEYRNNADIYIVERRKMLDIMKSFYGHFLGSGRGHKILDLGCGDGILTHVLLDTDNTLSATLVDASEDMLNHARARLKAHDKIDFINASFQELVSRALRKDMYDFAVSGQSIHHLSSDEKQSLFRAILSLLRPGGYFLNIDVVLAPADTIEQWYMKLWQEWMDEKLNALGRQDVSFQDIVRRYKEAEENRPDTLDYQLGVLREIGFQEVDCYYKYGVFAVYGGRKERQ